MSSIIHYGCWKLRFSHLNKSCCISVVQTRRLYGKSIDRRFSINQGKITILERMYGSLFIVFNDPDFQLMNTIHIISPNLVLLVMFTLVDLQNHLVIGAVLFRNFE